MVKEIFYHLGTGVTGELNKCVSKLTVYYTEHTESTLNSTCTLPIP